MTNLVGPMPETPEYPTPWVANSSEVFADNGLRVALVPFDVSESHSADLARLIADAVNEKYGKPSPVAEDDEPKPGDRVRVVECCPGNPLDACKYVVGSEGTLVGVKSTGYLVRKDPGGTEMHYKVAKV